jgi:hypothetical protein
MPAEITRFERNLRRSINSRPAEIGEDDTVSITLASHRLY